MQLSSGTNQYIKQGLLVQGFKPSHHDKDINLPNEEFTIPAQTTHLYERQFYEWTSPNHLKNALSYVNVRYHFPFRLHTHVEEKQFHVLSEHVTTYPYKESSGCKNAFGIVLRQHLHCHHKIHTRN